MSRMLSRALLGLCLVLPSLLIVLPASSQTLPDTTCASAVGVGPNDIPHAYVGVLGATFSPTYACPDHYPGENGFGINGALLFSRDGVGIDSDDNLGGDGVTACYGSSNPTAGPTTAHHGAHTTVKVLDDAFGGAVGFSLLRDWNRSVTNPFLPVGNNNGERDCGDRIIEPCSATDESTVVGGCNHLDATIEVFPASGLCSGLPDLGTSPSNVPAVVAAILGWTPGAPTCTLPGANSFTFTGGGLDGYAGADGSVTVLVWTNARIDRNHAGTATTGAIWTE